MYTALHVREELKTGEFDYFSVELDEEDNSINLHLTTNIFISLNKDEWNAIVEAVTKATFGVW
jgi:hypothetical protein